MRCHARRGMILLLLAVLLMVGTGPRAHAQEQSLYWERFDVELDIREDGTLHVTEENYVNFTEGIFRFGFREIADERVTALRDFTVVVDGVPLRQDSSTAPGTFYLYEGDNGQGIRYFFPEPTSGQHHITLSYTVDGGHPLLRGGRPAVVGGGLRGSSRHRRASLVRVRLPQPSPPSETRHRVHWGSRDERDRSGAGNASPLWRVRASRLARR